MDNGKTLTTQTASIVLFVKRLQKLIFHTCQSCRNFDLSHASEEHVNAEYLRGLINVVPVRGAGDRAGRYVLVALRSTCILNCFTSGNNDTHVICHLRVFLTS